MKLICTISTVLLFAFPVFSQRTRQESLRGLKEISVSVTLGGDAVDDKLLSSQAMLTANAELRFRLAGIRVVSPSRAIPLFNIFVNTLKVDDDFYAVSYNYGLTQVVYCGESKSSISHHMWGIHSLSAYGSDVINSNVKRSVTESLDFFINDYLAANQK